MREPATTIDETRHRQRSRGYFFRQRWRDQRDFLLLVAPALIWFSLFMLFPVLYMFYVSTLDWPGLTKPSTFAGIKNFVTMFGDRRFLIALKQTATIGFVSLPVVFPVSFVLAFFLSQRPPGYRLLRVVFFTPAVLSTAAQSMMFVGVYLPDGVLNTVLRAFGLESLTRVWLANPSTVLGSITAVYYWGVIGWLAVLFFASLSNIPDELFEIARLDGANYWTRMWRIAFPLHLDYFGVMLMLEFVWVFLGFAQTVLLLTRGGPGNQSLVLGYLLYEQAFRVKRLGYSQAIGVFVFVVGLVGMLLIRRVTRRTYQS